MAKYLKKFKTHAEYQTYITGSDKVLSNVSYCVDVNDIHYNPWPDPRLIVKYNVEDDSNPTMLYFCMSENGITLNGAAMFDKVELDGVEMSITDLDNASGIYQLSEGEHIARYTLKEPTFIGIEIIDESTQQMNIGATFMGCTAISEVKIPNSVTTIGYIAFCNCTGLTNVIIPNSVTTIGVDAFSRCSGLTSITIPNSVTSIGGEVFADCFGLTSITIPNDVTSIGVGVFSGCISLTSVTLPNSITSIGESAFYNCRSLISIVIPNSVTEIEGYAFSGCAGLTNITIPDSVTSIGFQSFRNCVSLISVTVQATTPPTITGSEFLDNATGRKIYVPSESVNAYKAASGWSDYAADIEAIQ